ncbi:MULTISPECIES: hypothetical protein [Streptomyces]|uniref:Uncharacterized protein n=1 Tax=Streptomyces pini TaxID=1520580 RepID=A0A1I3WKG1_9ACTN|nr:hypothetical protein [Streptomyces pini]SFK08018.1 hypothetical protein SAMN05192584_103342 [Streptomyces pini]
MSSFGTHRARVHDAARPAHRRLSDLRTCLQHFAPYGFRATYHHLRGSAGIPGRPERDPDSLVRAVEELHAARQVWLAAEAAYAGRRVREKRAGRRQPGRAEAWQAQRRRWHSLAYCPDPRRHPAEPLPVVVRRVLCARPPGRPEPGGPPVCWVCAGPAGTELWRDGYWTYTLCAGCGVSLRRE